MLSAIDCTCSRGEGDAERVVGRLWLDLPCEVPLRDAICGAGHAAQVGDHRPERVGELADLVLRAEVDPLVDVASGDAGGRPPEPRHGVGQPAREQHGNRGASQHRNQGADRNRPPQPPGSLRFRRVALLQAGVRGADCLADDGPHAVDVLLASAARLEQDDVVEAGAPLVHVAP
jgi:hypothetical protein